MLQKAVVFRDVETVFAILDGVSKAHAVHFEKAPHGLFVKCFFARRGQLHIPNASHKATAQTFHIGELDDDISETSTVSTSPCSTNSCSPSPNPRASPEAISRTTLLQLRAADPGPIVVANSPPKSMNRSTVDALVGQARYAVKGTFVHVASEHSDTEAVSVASAPPGFPDVDVV